MIRSLPLAVALFAVPLSSVQAQHPIILQRLEQASLAAPTPNTDLLADQVRLAAKNIYRDSETCQHSVVIESVGPASADRFPFAGIARGTIRNAWFVTARLPGCDEALVRFSVTQNSDGSFHTIRVNRGRSYAWDSLIGDTLPLAYVGALAALKRAGVECEAEVPKLGAVRISSEESDLGSEVYGIRYTGRWTEIWPLLVCDRTVEVPITFNADGDGGAYTNVAGDNVAIVS